MGMEKKTEKEDDETWAADSRPNRQALIKYLNESLDGKKHVYVSFKTVFTKPKTKNIKKKADRTHAYELKYMYMSETTEPYWGCTHYQILEGGKVETIADVDLRLNRVSEDKFQLQDKIS